jgi:hypothetical protein
MRRGGSTLADGGLSGLDFKRTPASYTHDELHTLDTCFGRELW